LSLYTHKCTKKTEQRITKYDPLATCTLTPRLVLITYPHITAWLWLSTGPTEGLSCTTTIPKQNSYSHDRQC